MRIKHLLIAAITFFCLSGNAQPGALLPGFGTGGLLTSTASSFDHVGVQPSGKVLVASMGAVSSEIHRYNADGSPDNSFRENTGILNITYGQRRYNIIDMEVQSDGKILVLGRDSEARFNTYIFRYNIDGTPDTDFGRVGLDITSGLHELYSMTLDAAGKIVVTGTYLGGGTGDAQYKLLMAKFNGDGSPDLSFNNGGYRIVVETDGEDYKGFLVRTDNTSSLTVFINSSTGFLLRRYKPNGFLETSFGTNGEIILSTSIQHFDVDASGKVVYIYGTSLYILNANGTSAGTFTLPTAGSADKTYFQNDGKILITGTKSNGTSHSNFWLMRFLANGNADASFGTSGEVVTNWGISAQIESIALFNRRIYASGYVRISIDHSANGALAVYDGSDLRMTCPTPLNPYNVDAGKCYATVNNINAVMSSLTLYANVQHTMVHNGTTITGEGGVAGKQFQLGTTNVTYSYTDITTQTCSFDITVTDQDPPVARCKNVTVQLDASGNGTLTTAQVDNGSTDGCGIQSRTLSKTSFSCSDPSSNTVTLTVTDIHGNSSTCTATVTVVDNVPPVAKCKNITVALNASGTATITASQIDDGSTDACGIKSLVLSKTSFDCSNKGNNQVILTVTDNNNNVSTCAANVSVIDDLPPIITAVVPTPAFLWPSDRKMKNVTVSTTSTDNCPGTTCRITAVAIKAGEFPGDNIGPDWEITDTNTVNLRAEIPKRGIKRIYTITVTCTDAAGNSTTASTDVTVSHNIITPASGASVKIGTTVNLSGEFWDIPGKTHTAKWMIDDKIIGGTVTEPSGINNGTVMGSYKFTAAGVYKLRMNVTNQNGITGYSNTNENLDAIIVVYDPNGGYTYGGGYYTSPAGALIKSPFATGDATYGFTVNYKNGSLPKGETQFDFKVGDFEFNALNFDYLAISNAKAQFKGTGKIIGGQSGIGFIMTVIDGALDGTGVDKIRMKVYNRNTGTIYYDNQPGASDAALPTQAVGANSIVVISSINSNLTTAAKSQSEEIKLKVEEVSSELDMIAFPNPSANNFTISIKGNNKTEKITIQVVDMYGRIIETRNVNANSFIRFGDRYRPGTYLVKIMQGKEHKEIKLIKLSD